MDGLRPGGTERRVKRERGERREEGERGPRAPATRKENRNAIRYLEEHRPVRVEGLPRWQSRLRGCGATRRYASVAVTGHAVFGRSLRAGFSAAISAPLRFPLLSLSPPLALAGPAPETRVSIPEPHRASGTVTNNIPLDVMAHCPTRARCANPLRGSYTTLRSVPALARKATALRA